MSVATDSAAVWRENFREEKWLFSPTWDVLVFLGSGVVSLLALAVGQYAGVLEQETPEWAWVPFILLIDVAHVYATGFRVYFDRSELLRRPGLYFGTPIACFVVAAALYSESSGWFWRAMAYLAVFHFIRQQYGWVALYHRKSRDLTLWERRADIAAIYASTLYPLVYWHLVPRQFEWFVQGDFFAVRYDGVALALTLAALNGVYWIILAVYAISAVRSWIRGTAIPGKDIVVVTTAICWYVGIITFNSDYAFTVTNVVIHGVPYIAIIYFSVRDRWKPVRGDFLELEARQGNVHAREPKRGGLWRFAVVLVATIWVLAYVEELLWDRSWWNERAWLFGSLSLGEYVSELWMVPLLAVPQLTHYVLDGFIWKQQGAPAASRLEE